MKPGHLPDESAARLPMDLPVEMDNPDRFAGDMTFGDRLVSIREELFRADGEQGLSRYELADQLGITAGAMAHYETSRRMPLGNTLLTMCVILGQDPFELLTGRPRRWWREYAGEYGPIQTAREMRAAALAPPGGQRPNADSTD